MAVEARFPAMGTHAQVVVNGPAALLDEAERRIAVLEDRWTRFRDSELTALNASPGVSRTLSPETFALVERSVVAWERTRGLFDPTVHDAMLANGYDRSFERVGLATASWRAPSPAPGPAKIRLDRARRTATLPAGVRVDPGGIGKGLAADIIVAELLAAGADGALVGIGGDLRVGGRPDGADRWRIDVEDPHATHRQMACLSITSGAVASSTRLRRRWADGATERHHVLNPATGRPTSNDVDAATVVAGEAWWAEALATALMVGGQGPGSAFMHDAAAIVVTRDGSRQASPEIEETLR